MESPHAGLYGEDGASVWILRFIQVGGFLAVLATVHALCLFYVYKEARELELMWAFWVLIPPAWFAVEYFYIFRRKVPPGHFEGLKYGQEVASKVWIAVVGLLAAILKFGL